MKKFACYWLVIVVLLLKLAKLKLVLGKQITNFNFYRPPTLMMVVDLI